MLLIDGDVLLYKIGFAHNSSPLELAKYAMDVYLQGLRSHIPVKYFEKDPLIYISDGGKTFRHDIATIHPYKNTRNKEKPIHFHALKSHLLDSWQSVYCNNYEVDDYLGIDSRDNQAALICSIDKDVATLPGTHYHFDKKKMYFVSELGVLRLFTYSYGKILRGTGLKFFWAQMLMGDPTDTIPGVPGYGHVKAYEVLKDINDSIELGRKVYRIYREYFGNNCDKIFIEIGNLLWILREAGKLFEHQDFLTKIMEK
jgi:5'-3' exonuclease